METGRGSKPVSQRFTDSRLQRPKAVALSLPWEKPNPEGSGVCVCMCVCVCLCAFAVAGYYTSRLLMWKGLLKARWQVYGRIGDVSLLLSGNNLNCRDVQASILITWWQLHPLQKQVLIGRLQEENATQCNKEGAESVLMQFDWHCYITVFIQLAHLTLDCEFAATLNSPSMHNS